MEAQKRSRAQENLLKLPAECFGILPTTGGIILITAGEAGYKAIKSDSEIIERCSRRGMTAQQLVDSMNAEIGVTKAQSQAMQFGSMWGWHIPMADPDNYDEEGRIIKENLNSRK